MLNKTALAHARSLITQGKVHKESVWSFDAADGNRILGDPPDWKEYARWFLLKEPDADPETKDAYKYPYGKNGKVYRQALIAIRSRAAQQHETAVFDAAGELIEAIDGKEEAKLAIICAAVDGQIPTEFQLFPYGVIELHGEEPFTVDEEAMNEVIRRFEARGLDMVIDYEHQTEEGIEAPAAGWIKKLINRGAEGLWAVVEWTDRAREYLARREYRYFSPVFWLSKGTRKLLEVDRAALTNAPRLNRIRPIVAKHTDITHKEAAMELLKKLIAAMHLPEDATEDDVIAAVTAKADGADKVAAKEVLKALGMNEDADAVSIVAKIEEIKVAGAGKTETEQELATLRKDHDALKAKWDTRERDDRVAAALAAGKITPAQKEWAEGYALADPEGFDAFVAKAPQIVPLEELDKGKADMGGTATQQMDTLVATKLKEHPDLGHRKALDLVQKENPELATQYAKELQG
jgi:phage I-like protein